MRKLTKKEKSIKSIKRLAWKVLSEYIRRRDKGVCTTCGKVAPWKEMDCGHYLRNTERNAELGGNALWYDERNFGCQCFRCNRMQSGEGAIFAVKLKARGIDIAKLYQLWRKPKKWTREEIEKVIEYYESLSKLI